MALLRLHLGYCTNAVALLYDNDDADVDVRDGNIDEEDDSKEEWDTETRINDNNTT